MHLQLVKPFLIFANIFGIIDAFNNIHLRMSSSDNYLKTLSIIPLRVNHYQNDLKFKNVIDIPHNAKKTDKSEVEIDTFMLNMYKVENIYWNKNSKTIILKLKHELKDIYVHENMSYLLRLSNHTKIVSKAIKNFVVYPMHIDADAIMYKSEST